MSDHHTTCWYCDGELAEKHEHDHVQPRRVGGTLTVPTCLDCHNLKDRTTLHHWPADVAVHAINAIGAGHDLLGNARQAVIAVLAGASPAPMPIRSEQNVIDAIRALPAGPARVLMAKMHALGLDAERLSPCRIDRIQDRTAGSPLTCGNDPVLTPGTEV